MANLFNQSRKDKFLDHLGSASNHKDALSLFRRASEFEEKFGKDLCEFSVDEAQEFVDKSFPPRVSSKVTQLYITQRYCNWCSLNGYDGAINSFKKLRLLDIEAYKLKYVAGPAHLQRVLDAMFDKESEGTIDNTRRAYFWLAFIGIKSKLEALSLKTSAVNLNIMEVHSQYGDHKIYAEAVPCLRQCYQLTEFLHIHGDLYEKRMPRESGNLLLRGMARAKLNTGSMRAAVMRANEKIRGTGIGFLSYRSVWHSGVFYRIYERETSGVEINFRKETEEFMRRYDTETEKVVECVSVNNRDVQRFKDEYTCWKYAFHG